MGFWAICGFRIVIGWKFEWMFEYSRGLCRLAVDVLELDGAAITLGLDSDCGSWDVVAASSAAAQAFDDVQFSVAQGPVVDTLRHGVACFVDDLAVESARWPILVSHAPGLGVGWCGVWPVLPGHGFRGALTMHRTVTGTGYENSVEAARLAAAAGVALSRDLLLLEQTAASDPPMLGRETVSIASGMLAARLAISPMDAMAVLRAYSFQVDQPITDVATAVTDRTLDTTAIIDH